MKAAKTSKLNEILQLSGIKFSLLDNDGNQAFSGVKCRDFLSDVIACNWGVEESVSLYGFRYSRGTALTDELVIESYKHEKSVIAALTWLDIPYRFDNICMGEKEKKCIVGFVGGYGKSTFGMSAVTAIIRAYDLAAETDIGCDLERLCNKLEKKYEEKEFEDEKQDLQNIKAIIKCGGWDFIPKLNFFGVAIGEWQRSHGGSVRAFHERGGIQSLANGYYEYFGSHLGKGALEFINGL